MYSFAEKNVSWFLIYLSMFCHLLSQNSAILSCRETKIRINVTKGIDVAKLAWKTSQLRGALILSDNLLLFSFPLPWLFCVTDKQTTELCIDEESSGINHWSVCKGKDTMLLKWQNYLWIQFLNILSPTSLSVHSSFTRPATHSLTHSLTHWHTHTGKYENRGAPIPVEGTTFPVCNKGYIEDERHFLMYCTGYYNIRNELHCLLSTHDVVFRSLN